MLEVMVENLTKSYGRGLFEREKKIVLKDISFVLKKEKITALVGVNGAGKTTLIKLIMKIIFSDEGKIFYNGLQEAAFKEMSFLPERPYLYMHLKGREFLEFMGKLSFLDDLTIKERSLELAKKLHLEKALENLIKSYSKGMQQRLAIISTFLARPKMVILDEPFSGLDPFGRKIVKDLLREISEKERTTLFFTTHQLSDVEELAQEVLLLDGQKIKFHGGLQDLKKRNKKESIFHVLLEEYEDIEILHHLFSVSSLFSAEGDFNYLFGPFTSLEKDFFLAFLYREKIKIREVREEKKTLEDLLYPEGGERR